MCGQSIEFFAYICLGSKEQRFLDQPLLRETADRFAELGDLLAKSDQHSFPASSRMLFSCRGQCSNLIDPRPQYGRNSLALVLTG